MASSIVIGLMAATIALNQISDEVMRILRGRLEYLVQIEQELHPGYTAFLDLVRRVLFWSIALAALIYWNAYAYIALWFLTGLTSSFAAKAWLIGREFDLLAGVERALRLPAMILPIIIWVTVADGPAFTSRRFQQVAFGMTREELFGFFLVPTALAVLALIRPNRADRLPLQPPEPPQPSPPPVSGLFPDWQGGHRPPYREVITPDTCIIRVPRGTVVRGGKVVKGMDFFLMLSEPGAWTAVPMAYSEQLASDYEAALAAEDPPPGD